MGVFNEKKRIKLYTSVFFCPIFCSSLGQNNVDVWECAIYFLQLGQGGQTDHLAEGASDKVFNWQMCDKNNTKQGDKIPILNCFSLNSVYF